MNFVALRCTFSMRTRCLIVYGDHTLLPHSSFGRINAHIGAFWYLHLAHIVGDLSFPICLMKPTYSIRKENMAVNILPAEGIGSILGILRVLWTNCKMAP